jgi:hypothetical protein
MNKPIWVTSKCLHPEDNGKHIEAVAKNCIFKLRVIGHSKDMLKIAVAIEDSPAIDPPYLNQDAANRIEPHPNQSIAEFRLLDKTATTSA